MDAPPPTPNWVAVASLVFERCEWQSPRGWLREWWFAGHALGRVYTGEGDELDSAIERTLRAFCRAEVDPLNDVLGVYREALAEPQNAKYAKDGDDDRRDWVAIDAFAPETIYRGADGGKDGENPIEAARVLLRSCSVEQVIAAYHTTYDHHEVTNLAARVVRMAAGEALPHVAEVEE